MNERPMSGKLISTDKEGKVRNRMAYKRDFLFGGVLEPEVIRVIFPPTADCWQRGALIGGKSSSVVLRLRNEYQPVFYSPFTPLKGNLDGFEFWLNSIVSSGPQ
jgi:hypothetical protein